MYDITQIFRFGTTLIDKLWPDPIENKKAKNRLLEIEMTGELERARHDISVIALESQSQDRFVSRARPTYLYLMYSLFGFAIPMGVMYMFSPVLAERFTEGFKLWLEAIPEHMMDVFLYAYTGYTLFRTVDKGIDKFGPRRR